MTPITRRRLAQFRANRRGMVSLVVFGVLFALTLFAEFLANDRPLIVRYDNAFYYPVFSNYPETRSAAICRPTRSTPTRKCSI
jgi:microcin C transport system permease protein